MATMAAPPIARDRTMAWLRRSCGALAALLAALWPARSWAAGCGPLDLGACVDGAEYSFYAGIAALAWMLDRTLLQLAYQLDQLRWWLVQVAFTTAYQQLTLFVSPLYVPVATVALTIACLLFMLVPFTGRALLSIRQVIIWVILTPILLTVSGQLVAQAETIRVSIGAGLFTQAAAAAPGAIFGVGASDMADPQPLYPANPCGTGQLQRQAMPGQLHMDDLAAALLYASAGDIHCPDRQGPGFNLPDRFYEADPGFATAQYVGEMVTANDRRAAVDGMKDGTIRLLIGIFPCILAVCEMLVHLVLALSLAVVWISLPLGLIFVYFQSSGAGIAALLRRIVVVFQASWSSSFVMGLLFSALLAAASLGNAAAYAGFSIVGILLIGYLAVIAFSTLKDSFSVVSAVVESGTGLALRPAVDVLGVATAGTLASVAIGAMSGRTGSAAYAASAMLGRLPGMMELGEVAAGMGWLRDDEDAYRGLRAGYESRRDWRWARHSIERDAGLMAADHPGERAPRPATPAPADDGWRTSVWAPASTPPAAPGRADTTTNLNAGGTALAPVAPAPVLRRGETVIIEGEIVDPPVTQPPLLPSTPRRLAAPAEVGAEQAADSAGPDQTGGQHPSSRETTAAESTQPATPAPEQPDAAPSWTETLVSADPPGATPGPEPAAPPEAEPATQATPVSPTTEADPEPHAAGTPAAQQPAVDTGTELAAAAGALRDVAEAVRAAGNAKGDQHETASVTDAQLDEIERALSQSGAGAAAAQLEQPPEPDMPLSPPAPAPPGPAVRAIPPAPATDEEPAV